MDQECVQFAMWLYAQCGKDGLNRLLLGDTSFFDSTYTKSIVKNTVFALDDVPPGYLKSFFPHIVKNLPDPLGLYYSKDVIMELNATTWHAMIDAWIYVVYGEEAFTKAKINFQSLSLKEFMNGGLMRSGGFWWPEGLNDIKAELAQDPAFVYYMNALLNDTEPLFTTVNDAYFHALLETDIVVDFERFFEERDYFLTFTTDKVSYILPDLTPSKHTDLITNVYGYSYTLHNMRFLTENGYLPAHVNHNMVEYTI